MSSADLTESVESGMEKEKKNIFRLELRTLEIMHAIMLLPLRLCGTKVVRVISKKQAKATSPPTTGRPPASSITGAAQEEREVQRAP